MNKLTALKGLYDAQVRMCSMLRAQLDYNVALLEVGALKETTVDMIKNFNISAQKNHDKDLVTVEAQEEKLKGIFGEDLWKDAQ